MLALQHKALHRTRLPCRMVEIKRTLCFYIVVTSISQTVVFADKHFCASAGQLRCGELLFVVLLECWCELRIYVVVLEDRFDSFGDICELPNVRGRGAQVGCFERTSPGGALSIKDERALSADILDNAFGLFEACSGNVALTVSSKCCLGKLWSGG